MDAVLLNDIQTALASLVNTSNVYSSKTKVDKLYEAYILSCVVKALINLNCTLEARNNNNIVTTNFLFRLKPGYIFSPTTSSSFVYILYNSKEYELHSGVRVLGKSSVLHEMDVAIIEKNEADICRDKSKHPRQTKLKFLAECKFYGSDLPLNIGREYLGLCSEFRIRVKSIVSNADSNSIRNLLKTHRQTANFNFTPLQPNEINSFIGWLTNELKQVL